METVCYSTYIKGPYLISQQQESRHRKWCIDFCRVCLLFSIRSLESYLMPPDTQWIMLSKIGNSMPMTISRDERGPVPNTRYVKFRVVHAPGISGTFSPPTLVSDRDIDHGTCVRHVPWCMPGSRTSGFLYSRWREKRSRHSRHMRNSHFCVSCKRPMHYGFKGHDDTVMGKCSQCFWPFVGESISHRLIPFTKCSVTHRFDFYFIISLQIAVEHTWIF